MSTDFDTAVDRVRDAIKAIKADGTILREVRWSVDMRGNDVTRIDIADCTAYAALCDHLKAPRDNGRIITRGATHRVYDALTRDNKLLLVHACWPHLDCWGPS